MYITPRNDQEYSQSRLNKILGRRRLTFNPYTMADSQLLEKVLTTRWGNEYDIVQMVIMTFTRLRKVSDYRKFDGLYFKIGNDETEGFIYTGALCHSITARDTLQPVRSTYGTRTLRNQNDVERLIGKRAFVSHLIQGIDIRGNYKVAYRMHPLGKNMSSQAKTIREAMISAKIEMLQRLMEHPESPNHLSCDKGLFDFEPRIQRAIRIINRFPEFPIPQ